MRQPCECAADQGRFLFRFDVIGGRWRGAADVARAVERDLAPPFAEMIEARIAGDLVHPGGESGAVLVSVTIAQDAEEHVLNEVFSRAAIGGHAQVEVIERGLVTLEQNTELAGIAIAHQLHDLLVRR